MQKRRRADLLLTLKAAAVFVASFLLLRHLQLQTPFLVGWDGYYHIKYAFLMRTLGFLHEFPWAAQSIWASHFADKELLYHFYLIPFTYFANLATGMKYAAVLLGSLALTSFYAVVSLSRLRAPFLWYLLLLAAGSHFLYRISAPRPQVLSVILLLWAVYFMLERKRVALAIVAFVYCYSYTAFHLPLVLALIVSAERYVAERKPDWKTPLAVLAAMLPGVLINPYFPDNIRIFFLQNFAVPWMALQDKVDLTMGSEFDALPTRELLLEHLAVVVPYAVAVYLAFVRPRALDRRARGLFVVSSSLVFLTLLVQRFIEYSVPFTLWFLAAFYTGCCPEWRMRDALRGTGMRRLLTVCGVAIGIVALAGAGWATYAHLISDFTVRGPRFEEPAAYLTQHTQPDELVFTCDWDDTPELFYFNHRNRYPVFLDPSFMYLHDPELWSEWRRAARGKLIGRTHDFLSRHYRYGVCTQEFRRLKQLIEQDPRMEIVLETDSTYVFRIDR